MNALVLLSGAPDSGTCLAWALKSPDLAFSRHFSMDHRLILGAGELCVLPHGHDESVTMMHGEAGA